MSQRRFWSFSIISALYILAFAHPIVPLSAQSGNDKPQTAESNPKEVRRKPTNLELGMPVAFPMFRPAALASAGPVTVTTESTTAEESEEHMEFVPLPSTVRSGSAPFVPVAAQNPTEPVEQWSMGRVTRRPNEPFETTTPRDKAAVYDPCLTFGCKNNGSCDVKENFKPFCVCQQGFSGERCEVDMCSDLFCHHLVETCRIRNGHPVCECADGQAGERCRQKRQKTNFKPISRPTSSCPFKCENGGKCVVKQIPTGGEIALCECTYGFLGANCNIQDMCADNKTCAAYGPEAKCLVDAVSLSNKITSTLIKSPYLCMCYNDNSEWVDCSELPPSELPPVPNAPRAQPPPNPSDGPPHGSGSFESSSDGDDELPSPVPSLRGPSTPETLPPELIPEPKGNSSDIVVPSGSTQLPQFPMHVHVTASPTSDLTSKETSPFNVPNAQSNHTMDPPPPFPITNMSQKLINYLNTLTTKVPSQVEFQNVTKDVTKTEPTTLPFDPQTTPLSTTVQTTSKQDIATPELRTTKPTLEINETNAPAITSKPTETPAPFSFNTQPSPTSTSKESEKVVSGGEDDDEREGDNGFERVTQIASEISSETTTSPEEETTKAHILRPQIWPNGESTINRSEAIETHETDHFGARPPMGGFSPHEEHGGAFVSPSSGIGPDQEEHNHVEMEFPGKPADPFGPSSPMPIPPEHFSPDDMTEEHSHNNSVVHSGHEKGIQTSHTEKTDDQSKSGGNEFSSQKNGNNVRGGKGSEENKSLGVESNHVGSAEERVRVPDESKESSSFGNSTTWIIAIAVLSFLSLSAMTGAVCIARYIRRSRRLHGKYNPAREENAVSACTYSMPMTAISKEERLI